jgi:hypothetical protein
VKVRCIEAALELGWTLQEGASAPGSAFTIERTPDGISVRRDRRLLVVEDGSADLYVVAPAQLMLEIKARPDVGTKAQAQFEQMILDIRRVAQRPNMALLFVFDADIYSSFSGERLELRGRPSVHRPWFTARFPRFADVVGNGLVLREVEAEGAQLALGFFRVTNPLGLPRVLVVGARTDATF